MTANTLLSLVATSVLTFGAHVLREVLEHEGRRESSFLSLFTLLRFPSSPTGRIPLLRSVFVVIHTLPILIPSLLLSRLPSPATFTMARLCRHSSHPRFLYTFPSRLFIRLFTNVSGSHAFVDELSPACRHRAFFHILWESFADLKLIMSSTALLSYPHADRHLAHSTPLPSGS
ncbi:hypothetical protein FA13DRAFT_774152 [Coprinellus micaceus]|uniref:Secreted protein n=1 Tax=Coprinellus micaceus TaxID=71717 RepID=A0A4Y7T378_COPMI|nr:hypothetical protein FA13DRAFT_774152 [Coprinellus micaceus]